jgi:hypothetical protein
MESMSSGSANGVVQACSRRERTMPDEVKAIGRPIAEACLRAYRAGRDRLASRCVTAYLMGGCANQLFQYATGLALARRQGARLQLDVSHYDVSDTHRAYALGLFRGVTAELVHELEGEVIREQGLPYNPTVFENVPRRVSICGYWQCEKYFFGLREELSEQLSPREPLPAFHEEIARQIAQAGTRSVFLHVRRTDYVGNPFHLVLPVSYYEASAAVIAAKVCDPVFFIFSDDADWCRDNFKLPYPTVIADEAASGNPPKLRREDATLWLMRQCEHGVIANSSFSWWGAWLGADANGGIVVAPQGWFGPAWNEDPRDIVPIRWLRI